MSGGVHQQQAVGHDHQNDRGGAEYCDEVTLPEVDERLR